ncbi:hypothetical protein BH11BAC1_BH11BAC1_18390 [soil metagenome]
MNSVFKDSRKYTLIALGSFLFFLGLVPLVSSISLGLVILFWLKDKSYLESFRVIKQNRAWWVFMIFYFFHIISLAWSSNYKYAFFDLQIKLSYLVCPIVISGLSFSESDWKKFRKAFIAGVTVASLICVGHAFRQFSIYGEKEYFFHDRFSALMHPTYFMMYLNLAMIFIFYDLFWHMEEKSFLRRIYIAILFFQLIVLFLLSARTALATSLISFLFYIIVMARKKLLAKKDTMLVVLFFVFALLFQFGVLTFYNRYDQITKLIEQPDTKEENSTSIRYNLWKIAADLISEHPVIGVGIGDIKEELVKKYEEYNYQYGIINRISPHNQFLHTAVILGLIGVLLLIYMLATAFLLAWKNVDWIYVLFIMIISLNAITESILERQAGILFFVFFNSMFANRWIGPKRIS